MTAHEAARRAVTAWIEKGDAKAGRELVAALKALAAGGETTKREVAKPRGRPRKRKAA